MATYGRKFSIALFAIFMLTLSSIDLASSKSKDAGLLLEQKQALHRFFDAVKKSNDVNWDMNKDVCTTWKGVTCHPSNNFVWWLRLPGKSLIGQIPNNTIGKIRTLVKLSLRHNRLTGPIPHDFSQIEHFEQFTLQYNLFSGQLPNLNVQNISKNQFDVSYNKLDGYIPRSMSSLKNSSFDHNIKLCGDPLPRKCSYTIPNDTKPASQATALPENKSKNKFPIGAIVGIAIGSPLIFLILLSFLRQDIYLKPHNTQAPIRPQTSSSSKDQSMEEERTKLVSLEDGICSFGVEDLVRASAEVLGKGRIGTTCKVLMKEGAVVVVKRLKDVEVKKWDFESRMEILGKMKNENVAPLKAFYFSEDEKLLVYEYFPAGSVYDLLHVNKGSSPIPLDWEKRMGIALSAAKGLAYLHVSGKLVHGNFKSSNILLRDKTNKEGLVSDYGLNILFDRSNSPTVTMKSDVCSFGIFLLELLTRKVPNQTSSGKEGFDLPWLVLSVPQEEWKTKVFDMELMRHQNRNVEEEMLRLLEIATRCVSFVPNQQPTMGDVVRMMKDMKQDTLSIVTL